MRTGQAGLALIKHWEGCRLTAYKPVKGEKYWTIGWGHYGPDVRQGQTITQTQADAMLKRDLIGYENNVMKFNAKYHWNQNEFDALVSFAYNTGSINKLVKNGKRSRAEIADKLLEYNKGAGGKELEGLKKRRQAERDLFLRPVAAVNVEKEDDEMVEKSKIIVNGKEVPVRRILKDGTNFIAVRDAGDALGYEVSAKGNIPVLNKK